MSDTERPVFAVVLTALDDEADAFRAEFPDGEIVETPRRRYLRAPLGDADVVVWSFGAMGNVASAVAARTAIGLWNPEYVVLAGIAGGAKTKGRALGDVLVPTQVVYPELGKVTTPDRSWDVFIPSRTRSDLLERRWEVFRPAAEFVDAVRVAEWSEELWTAPLPDPPGHEPRRLPEIVYGTVASGEKVIGSENWMADFATVWPKAVGVEMEGIGVALAAYQADEAPRFGLVKAISDWADASKNDDWRIYAARAAARVTRLALGLLASTGSRTPRPTPQVEGSNLSTDAPTSVKDGWGRRKVCLCRRLTNEQALDMSDLLEIPRWEREGFRDGICRGVWEWLEMRDKLSELPQLLLDVSRRDLAEALESADPNAICAGVLGGSPAE